MLSELPRRIEPEAPEAYGQPYSQALQALAAGGPPPSQGSAASASAPALSIPQPPPPKLASESGLARTATAVRAELAVALERLAGKGDAVEIQAAIERSEAGVDLYENKLSIK